MKQNRLFKQLLVIVFALVGSVSVWGTDVSVTFSSKGYTNGATVESCKLNDDITVSFSNGKYYTTGTAIRAYGGSTFTVTSTNGNITSITLSFGTGDGSNAITTTVGTFNSPTWSGSATSVEFSVGGSSGHRRVSGVSVTYGGSTKTSLSAPTNLSSSNVTSSSATLSWDAVANASSYTVKISSTEYTNVNTNSYSATGLTASTEYTWTVKAIGDDISYTSSDYAANANFTTSAAATYTVTWTVEGATYSTTTDVASGSKVAALPTDPESSCEGTFAGWVKSNNGVVGQKPGDEYTTDPTPFTTIGESPAITGDTEFVAVFKKEL